MKLCLVCHLHFSNEQEVCPKDNSPLMPLGEDPLVGMVIQDRYRIESIIGRGAMGLVYKAIQEPIGRPVAVKVLHTELVTEPDSLKRFHQQARAASRLNHPHVITLYDYGVVAGGQPYIAMELLSGKTLAATIEESGFLSWQECLPIFKQICEALAEAHKYGVVHRDVKPDNIVLEERAKEKYFVKVVDFGIAKLLPGIDETSPRITKTGLVCGSPAYMSPEQYQGKDVDHRSDIYSLGAVLYEALTGRIPFKARDLVGLMTQHLSEPPPKLNVFRPDVVFPPGLDAMIRRSMAKNPDDRPLTMNDFYQEMEAACFGTKVIPAKTLAEGEALTVEQVQSMVKSQKDLEIKQSSIASVLPASSLPASRSSLPKPRIPVSDRLLGLLQVWFPYILTAAVLFVLGALIVSDTKLYSTIKRPITSLASTLAMKKADARLLFAQGKYDQVINALEQKADDKPLSNSETELLNQSYIRLAQQQAQQHNYRRAIQLLQKITGKQGQSSRVKSLLAEFRRLSSK